MELFFAPKKAEPLEDNENLCRSRRLVMLLEGWSLKGFFNGGASQNRQEKSVRMHDFAGFHA
ncbi:MAG: hypothetical protein IPM86_07725 [Saprospiraceae bacterium]|nr:hypothetical protein [Saprospiraceae bacterium]